jgi:KDO2-lipid IV(A) lauroyltransferase
VTDRLVAWLVRWLFALLRALPVDVASSVAGAVARTVGPLLKVHRIAERNMRRALPLLSDAEIKRALRGMWDNLGRTAGEFPHVHDLRGRVEFFGREHFESTRNNGGPGLFVSGHIGNWELLQQALTWSGLTALVVYRAANNAPVDAIFQRIRATSGNRFAAKGKAAARAMLAELRRNGHVAMLIDQKQNDGIAVPFFGRDAMTAPAVAEMALRLQCPILPLRCERLDGARFRVTAYPAFIPEDTGDRDADLRATMLRIHAYLESWIAERPDLWFWFHRRWPD